VWIWFSETLIPQTSTMLVVDTANHEVDNKDSQVLGGNEMRVTLPLLPAGTYVVVWRSQSAFDGHIAEGSFLFRIARPDGTVPPVPAVLPTGHFPGAAGNGTLSDFNGYTVAQTLMTWFALLCLTFWVGGVIWEIWILAPGQQRDADLREASRLAGRRFQRLIPAVLILLLLADLGIVLAQAAALAGDWSGAFSLPLLLVILFQSRFGEFWWMRQIVVGLALVLTILARHKGWRPETQSEEKKDNEALDLPYLPDWSQAVLASLRDIRHLPRQLVRSWQAASWYRRLEGGLGAILLLAFALSGHAAAVPSPQIWYSLGSDLLHLVGDTVWVGGLFYIGAILIPVLFRLPTPRYARVLALGLPAFSALAIITVIVLAATGSLNTTVHLTAFDQFWTTLYGRTLTVKIALFLVLIVISAYHAFFLRTQLVQALNTQQKKTLTTAGAATGGTAQLTRHEEEDLAVAQPMLPAHRLTKQMTGWLQLEALGGAAILLCVALLGAFGGTLTTGTSATSTNTSSQGSQAHGPFTQTQSASGYIVTLSVTPDTFGTNTFTVRVQDTQHHNVTGAGVLLETNMLDMDMGTETTQLQSVAHAPGSYAGQSDLTMAGHWQVIVRLLPPNQNTFLRYIFKFSAN
jgi:putative copper export protein